MFILEPAPQVGTYRDLVIDLNVLDRLVWIRVFLPDPNIDPITALFGIRDNGYSDNQIPICDPKSAS